MFCDALTCTVTTKYALHYQSTAPRMSTRHLRYGRVFLAEHFLRIISSFIVSSICRQLIRHFLLSITFAPILLLYLSLLGIYYIQLSLCLSTILRVKSLALTAKPNPIALLARPSINSQLMIPTLQLIAATWFKLTMLLSPQHIRESLRVQRRPGASKKKTHRTVEHQPLRNPLRRDSNSSGGRDQRSLAPCGLR